MCSINVINPLRLVVLLGFVALLLWPAAPSYAQSNELENPGFEDGTFLGWSHGGDYSITDVITHNGAYAAMGTSNTKLSQCVTATAGTYEVSAWLLDEDTASDDAIMQILINGSLSYTSAHPIADNTWTFVEYSNTGIANGDELCIRLQGGAGSHYDDTSLARVTTPTPVPTEYVPQDDDFYYQFLYVDGVTEVTDVGATFCPRSAGDGEKVIVQSFGAYELVEGGCFECQHGYCTAGDFKYTANPEPEPFVRTAGGMPAMTKPAGMYDAFPVLSFSRSFGAWRASLSGVMSSNLIVVGMATFVAIVISAVLIKALIGVFVSMPSYGGPSVDGGGSSVDTEGGYDGQE